MRSGLYVSPGLYELSEETLNTKCANLKSQNQNHVKTKILLTSVFKELAFLASAPCAQVSV